MRRQERVLATRRSLAPLFPSRHFSRGSQKGARADGAGFEELGPLIGIAVKTDLWIILGFCAALVVPSALVAQDTCVVTSITDGDTLRCNGAPIRLLLINTPEMDQGAFGEVAKEALSSLAPVGTELRLEYDVERLDRYDRTLAYLYLPDGRMVNEELLRVGVAIVIVYPPNVKYVDQFRQIQDAAEGQALGLWEADAFSCTPSDHRAGNCDP